MWVLSSKSFLQQSRIKELATLLAVIPFDEKEYNKVNQELLFFFVTTNQDFFYQKKNIKNFIFFLGGMRGGKHNRQ